MSSEVQGLETPVSYNELFEIWKDDRTDQSIFVFLKTKYGLNIENPATFKFLSDKSKNIAKNFLQKYRKCRCSVVNFKNKHRSWLEKSITFEELIQFSNQNESADELFISTNKPFNACSSETKRKRVEHLLRYSSEELAYATQLKLYSEGKRKAANIIKDLMLNLDNENIKLQTFSLDLTPKPSKLSPEEALATYVQSRLSKFQYIQIHKECKKHNADIYPGYDSLLNAKKQCYPSDISISEDKAEVSLQSIIDLSINRIFIAQKEVLLHIAKTISSHELSFHTIIKWGCDGAAGFNSYKQMFVGPKFDDSFLFEISFVMIEIKCINNQKLFWKNPKPSSSFSCRPIKILFCKESANLVKTEVNDIQTQILNLRDTCFEMDDIKCVVKHDFYMTMIDGKVCGIVNETSSCNCYICGAKPSQMNNPLERPIDQSVLSKFGISSLHAWIKCMECMLHISYRIELKSRMIRKADEPKVKPRMDKIKEDFITELGLKVDTVKQGFGNYNDGNTARSFFENFNVTSRITGVDENLIRRIGVLLKAISSGYKINIEKLKKYAFDTAELYKEKYNWYFMPVTLHKILFHSADIAKESILPIGQLSEEALESRHKDAKRFREHNTRKCSRLALITDLFHTLLYSSDPFVNSLKQNGPHRRDPLDTEVLSLLLESSADEANT